MPYLFHKAMNLRYFYSPADINECLNSCACPNDQECVNTEGSFECRGRYLHFQCCMLKVFMKRNFSPNFFISLGR